MLNSTLKDEAIYRLEHLQNQYSKVADQLQNEAIKLYTHRTKSKRIIDDAEILINKFANTPKSFEKDMEEIKFNKAQFSHALDLEKDSEQFAKVAGFSAVGAGAIGAGVAAFGPSAAMAIATTFGTASTGAVISGLSGAAATNAALAWLGGGALAAGGGGMAAGNAFLAMAGPIGWGIGAVSLGIGLVSIGHKNKKIAEEADEKSGEVKQAIEKLNNGTAIINKLAMMTHQLNNGIYLSYRKCCRATHYDYNQLTLSQKEELGALVNNLKSLSILINKRIDGETMREINYQKVN